MLVYFEGNVSLAAGDLFFLVHDVFIPHALVQYLALHSKLAAPRLDKSDELALCY